MLVPARRLCDDVAMSGLMPSRPDALSQLHGENDDLEEGARRGGQPLARRYRAVVVLCDLEDLSYEQAARSLGWPMGTVKSRLARGT